MTFRHPVGREFTLCSRMRQNWDLPGWGLPTRILILRITRMMSCKRVCHSIDKNATTYWFRTLIFTSAWTLLLARTPAFWAQRVRRCRQSRSLLPPPLSRFPNMDEAVLDSRFLKNCNLKPNGPGNFSRILLIELQKWKSTTSVNRLIPSSNVRIG